MKKKIAIFANGLNAENLMKFMSGLRDSFSDESADFFVFLSHDSYANPESINRAEWAIFDLPDLTKYDAAIIFFPGLNFSDVNEKLIDRCRKAGLPVISICNNYENSVNIHTDNYHGMLPLINHILDEHKVQDILFIAGPADNDESNERLKAVKDACEARNIPFTEDNIFYSNWVAYDATTYIRKNYLEGKPLPDAIVCANDKTAFFVCLVLEDLNIKCPEDVIVTGFDGNYQAMTYFPAITTVIQPFYKMGRQACECINAIFSDKEIKDEYYIPCEFRFAESCGCKVSDEYDRLRRKFSQKQNRKIIITEYNMIRLKGMHDAVLKSESYSTIDTCLQDYFYSSEGFEGNPFYICMDPLFAKLGEIDVDALPKYTFGDYYYMLVGKQGVNKYPTHKYYLSEGLIPHYINDDKNHMYVFMPIYFKTFICGYIIMGDDVDYFGDELFNFFKTYYLRLLDPYRKNMQLTALNAKLSHLMNKDVLTSTKNRTAYEAFHSKLVEKAKKNELGDIAFILADINNLKLINDTLGHESGDEYIINSSSLLCNTFKNSPVFRMGGDEFLVVLQDTDFVNRYSLIKELKAELTRISETETDMVKKVSFAYGMSRYDSLTDKSIDDAIKRADEEMYINKRNYKQYKRY